jgi:SAM-dependent methyltransferase
MPLNTCRVCGRAFFADSLARYVNVPKAAQFLPDATALAGDRGVELDVRQCSGCGLVQLSNEPVPYYREVIRAAGVSEEMAAFRRRQFGAFAQRYGLKNKAIIEIGCGRGEYLSLMQPFVGAAYGLEQAEDAVRACKQQGLKVARGFMEDDACRLEAGPFDAFFMLNFLEHLPNPNAVLRGIGNNLTAGGIGLVEVPNFDMILGNKLFSEFTTDHLFYFTRATLTTVMNLNGFEVVECAVVWHDYIISAVVRRRRPLEMAHFERYRRELAAEVEAYIRRYGEKKVAIWGAGHQALAVIALMNLASKIKYVIDSAPFKQGKYTPATHLPIVAPTALDTDPVEAVLVMAASYSDEVARTIRQNYGARLNVAILRDCGLELI